MQGTYKGPLPRRVVTCNVFDHITCEMFFLKTTAVKQSEPTSIAKAMEKAQRNVQVKLNTPVLL